MGRSSILSVLTRLLLIWGQLASPSVSQPQPLINQLAALFRARPAWPTSFHSDPNANQNLIGDSDTANSINYSENDFTNLNELLTSGNMDSQQNSISGSNTGPEGVLGSNSFYISSSTPPIIVKDASGNKPKGVLIAHPVLGPNQLSMNPEHKYNFQQHRPQGSTSVRLINSRGMGGGLYAAIGGSGGGGGPHSGNFKPSGPSMVTPSLQSLISEGLKNALKSQRQNHKMKMMIGSGNNNKGFPRIFAVEGTPPTGARVIAIPVPSKIPFNPNSNSLQFQNFNQQQQQNQPGVLNYFPTGQNTIKVGPSFIQNANGFVLNQNHPIPNPGFQQPQQPQLTQQQQNSVQTHNQQGFQQNGQSFSNNLQNPQGFQQNVQRFQQTAPSFSQNQLSLPQNIFLQNLQNQKQPGHNSFHLSQQNFPQPQQNTQPVQTFQYPSQFLEGTTPPPQFTPSSQVANTFYPSPRDYSSLGTSSSTTTTSPSTSPTSKITTTSPSTTTTTIPSTTRTTTTIPPTTTTSQTTTTTPPPSFQSPYTSAPLQYSTSYPAFNILHPTTQPPWRHYTSNNIQEVIVKSNSHHHHHISPNQLHPQHLQTSPSTVIGTFRYPDPPSPPQLQSLNTHYELPSQLYVTKSPQQLYNSYTDLKKKKKDTKGYFEPSISSVSPFATSTTTTGSTTGRASNSIQVSDAFDSVSGSGNKWVTYHEGHTTTSKANTRQPKSQASLSSTYNGKTDTNFRPSPQLHSFEDSTSGLREYITVNPPSSSSRDSKSLQLSDDLPAMESGFRPFNHFAFSNGVPGASISTTTEHSVLNLLRNEFLKEMKSGQINQWSEPDPTGSSLPKTRHERQYNTGPSSGYNNVNSNYNSYLDNQYKSNPSTSSANPPTFSSSFPTANSFSNSNTIRYSTSTANPLGDQWVGRLSSSSGGGGSGHHHGHSHNTHQSSPYQVTTASSELYEDWLVPRRESTTFPSSTTTKRPIYFTLGKTKNPLECEKFHRFGFCPVTSQYPLEQVEAIGSRCSTLLSHLVAPLPKTDVRYDVIVPKNGTHVKGRSAAPSGWSWKTFSGKPVCDTKEVKIVPGWAKNEQGEWLVILQSEKWKQEAQISLCTSQGTHYCNPSDGAKCEEEAPRSTKCVQRFTAQRLVVLDPDDLDRCPVVRSVFLPSACVCLDDGQNNRNSSDKKHHHHSKRHHPNSNNHETSNGHSSSSNKKSHKKTGRSLSTSFFGLGNDVAELETAADSSTSGLSGETTKPLVVTEIPAKSSTKSSGTTSTSTKSPPKESSDEDIPVISIRNPLNATVMVVTSEKVSDDGSASTESSSTESTKNAITTSTSTVTSTSTPLFSSSTSSSLLSSLGAAFINSSRETSTESSSSSSKSEENET